jgi:hypothetical protein
MPVIATIGTDALKSYDYCADYNRDQYFSSLGCLITSSGTTGANTRTYVDSSSNNFTVTSSGNTTQQGTFSPFAKSTSAPYNPLRRGGSAFFTGTAGTYLSVPDNAALEVGSGGFCIELFVNSNSIAAGVSLLVGKRTSSSAFGPFAIVRDAANIKVSLSSNGTSNDVANAVTIGTITADTWYHVALYRVGTAIYGSVGGTVVTVNGSTSATLINNTSAIFIGSDSATQPLTGYISSLRLVVGSSVYTSSNFTPPTVPLTAITNTQLLLNFTNSFIYDAAQNINLYAMGTCAVTTSLRKWGGTSINFPVSTGEYIQSILAPSMAMGSGDFTIDFWFYQPSSLLTYIMEVFSNNSGRMTIRANANATITVFGNGLSTITSTTTTYAFSYSTWTHITIMRISGDIGIYVNGVRGNATASNTTNFTSTGGFALGGLYTTAQSGGTGGFNLSEFRATAGVARFLGTPTQGVQPFTPPNGPAPLVGN